MSTSTAPLFAMSLEERRETFVRKHFHQEFHNPNITDLLSAHERLPRLFDAHEQQDMYYYTSKHILHVLKEMAVQGRDRALTEADLSSCLSPIPAGMKDAPYTWQNNNEAEKLHATVEELLPQLWERPDFQAYWGLDRRMLAIVRAQDIYKKLSFWRIHIPEDAWEKAGYSGAMAVRMERVVRTHEFMEAIFAEWFRGKPKAEAARALCMESARQRLKMIREKAENDFNTAVAVSADGEKIVHADEVHIGRYALAHFVGILWEPYKVIPTTTCQQHKIMRIEGELRRFKDNWDAGCHAGTETKQGLILNGGDGKRVFFTTKEFCPPELLV